MSDLTMGQRIAEQRKRLGISQEGLGEKMGVSRQAISKWEADGAVPEIDKLIALSRLFGVSVGWLLGVEEEPEKQPDELTDTQLKMVEEIVRRYQPAQPPKQEPDGTARGLRGAISVLLLVAALVLVVTLVRGGNTEEDSGLAQQIAQLQSDYSGIRGQLSTMNSRLDDLAENAENQEKLLSRYDMKLTAQSAPWTEENAAESQWSPGGSDIVVDIPTATLSFAALPKQYAQTERAYLSVLLEGKEWKEFPCTWDGIHWTAEPELYILDGYSFCFVLELGDGTRQMEMLELPSYSKLASCMEISCRISHVELFYGGGRVRINDLFFYADKPTLGIGVGEAAWTAVDMVLCRNGEEVGREPLIADMKALDLTDTDGFNIGYTHEWVISIPELAEGDQLELYIYLKLSCGTGKETLAGSWVFQDGELTETTTAAAIQWE